MRKELSACLLAVTTSLPCYAQAPAIPPPEVSGDAWAQIASPGQDGCKSYRIPGLTVSKTGTLLAVFDKRYDGAGDLPANIDVGLSRSTDNGKTWSGIKPIIDFDAREKGSNGNGAGDPSILVDPKDGTIWVAALWSCGNHGWHGSGPGLAKEETGQFIMVKSTDDGQTWSKPINITGQVKKPEWKLCLQGPGNGIALSNGTLVFPAQYRDGDKAGTEHSFFVYSSDHGTTWKSAPPATPEGPRTTEAQICELGDGSLLLSMRNHAGNGKRCWAVYKLNAGKEIAGGAWEQPTFALPDPVCAAGLASNPQNRNQVIFTNPSGKGRANLTAYLSEDGGKTWPFKRLLQSGAAAYSSTTFLHDGSIGTIYETAGIRFVRYTMDWIKRGDGAKISTWITDELPACAGVKHLGVARPFWGVNNGVMLLCGGSNFPDKPAAEGGARICHDEIFVTGTGRNWTLCNEKLPNGPVAEGIPITSAMGLACLGGMDGRNDLSNAFLLSWDPGSARIQSRALPPLPKTIRMGAGAAWEQQLLVACGRQNGKTENGFWRLNLDQPEKGWIPLQPVPGVPREQAVAAVLTNSENHPVFCLFGGNGIEPGGRQMALTDGYTYDLTQGDQGTWKPAASIHPKGLQKPVSLLGASAVSFNGKMFCAGGFDKEVWDESCLHMSTLAGEALSAYRKQYLSRPPETYHWNRHLLAYDAMLNEWADCGELPLTPRCGAAMVVLPENVLVLATGEIAPGRRTPETMSIKFQELLN